MTLMTISQQGRDFIKQFERLKLQAYKPVDTEKYYTIGYGHYGADVKKDMTITKEKAEALFKADIEPLERELNKLNINFTQGQFDALVSWLFNLGVGNFISSTMYKKIMAKAGDEEITDQMIKWVMSNGKPLNGLKKRRVAEANMFLGKARYIYSEGLIKKVKV